MNTYGSNSLALALVLTQRAVSVAEMARALKCGQLLIKTVLTLSFFFQKRLSAQQAKSKVFEHWNDLEAFAKKRFPDNDNQAYQALDYGLEQLQANDWERVRQWEGKGRFLTFLLTLTARLLTDFTRKQYGHQRPPKWLLEKSDPLWQKAYKHLMVEKFSRYETIELLRSFDHEPEIIHAIVEEILAKCNLKLHQPQFASDEELAYIGTTATEPTEELCLGTKELIEVLVDFLTAQNQSPLPVYLEDQLLRLQSSITLQDEDRMLLYLRFVEGKSMNDIVKLLALSGNPYKRLNKLIDKLQAACEQAGLMMNETRERE